MEAQADDPRNKMQLRRKVLSLAPVFQILDMRGNSLLYCHQKLFKLKADIRVYTDQTMQTELLAIKARNIIDFAAAYDVEDAKNGEKVGALRRKGLASIIRDEWHILDLQDNVVGMIREDGLFALRRMFKWLPQKYTITLGADTVGTVKQSFNPFVFKAVMDLNADPGQKLDRRLALAAGILLMAIEGRQK